MYTIGEFSKLSHISARMLRHYDFIGLLHPSSIGKENGYRYYEAYQLSRLRKIETLKSYGFTLNEVQLLLPLSNEELLPHLCRRLEEARKEQESLDFMIKYMESNIMKLEGKQMANNNYSVTIMENPEQSVFGIRRVISMQEVHQLFQDLHREAEKRGLKQAGPTQQMYLGESFDPENADVEAQIQVLPGHPDVKTLPKQTCVATIHKGPYHEIHQAYDAVCEWIANHPEYKICAPSIERYIKDETMTSNPDELETGVLFPVEKIQ